MKEAPPSPTLISLNKIWDQAEHNAMTDLIYFKNAWYCVFRESNRHVHGVNGTIRIIKSVDTLTWKSKTFFIENDLDLRDPKLSITPQEKLMLLFEGVEYTKHHRYVTRRSYVAFSDDGKNWTSPQAILDPHEWLWRVTWHLGKAYGVSYRYTDPSRTFDEWEVSLFVSENGLDFHKILPWKISGKPNETTLRFIEDDKMIALVRRDGQNQSYAWIGTSSPPYTNWDWNETKCYLGGPNFLVMQNGTLWAGGRISVMNPYGYFEHTALVAMTKDNLLPVLFLPSGGDCSYPGMVEAFEHLWMSYYSSHEGKASIYLAKILIN